MSALSRRSFLIGSVLTGAAAVSGCSGASAPTGTPLKASSGLIQQAEQARRSPGQRTVSAALTARPLELDLGGSVISTWGYGDSLPGPVVRATAGDILQISVDNQLPEDTSVHWHGVALRNDMDGVPGLTQDPIAPREAFTYEFTAPHPGTYFYHSHSGLQPDRGLYGALIIDDPAEPGDYDHDWTVVLDDWLDGTGTTPDAVATELGLDLDDGGGPGSNDGHRHAMAGRHGDDGPSTSPFLGVAGDVTYPYFLVNGRGRADPESWTARPGQRVRLRLINAGADTAFRVAIGGHHMTVTHTDGFPVVPEDADAVLLGMGERVDVVVTLGDGVFGLIADAEGKNGHALGVIRTGAGTLPADLRPDELDRQVVLGADLSPAPEVQLPAKDHDIYHSVDMGGTMSPYRWTLNGDPHPDTTPLTTTQGQRVRLRLRNMSDMFHPMHLHGHTFALTSSGLRKDTLTVRPMHTVEIEFDSDNPGQWAFHCHNAYHRKAGMMTTLSYVS